MREKQQARGFWVPLMGLMLVFSMLGITPAYAANDEITVGFIGPMRFMHGQQSSAALNMRADEINAAGGITVKGKKYKVKIKVADDNEFASIPDAISAMERLSTRDKVKYIIGGFTAETIMALQDVMADNKVIYLSIGAGAEEITKRVGKNYNRYKYYFRPITPSTTAMGTIYVAQTMPIIDALKKIGIAKPKIALITDQSAWTTIPVEIAQKLYPALGCEIVGSWKTKHTATTYIAELSAAKSAGAHIIFHCMSGPPGNIIVRQWGELQIPAVLTGINAEAMKDVNALWAATDGKCNYMSVGGSIDAAMTPFSLPFKAKFTKAVGQEPSVYAAGAYDALLILKEAMERGNTLDPEALIPALEKTYTVGAWGRYAFNPPGHERPHDCFVGSEWIFQLGTQIIDKKRYVYWPDGKELPPMFDSMVSGSSKWGIKKVEGTREYVLPPFVSSYWKDKK